MIKLIEFFKEIIIDNFIFLLLSFVVVNLSKSEFLNEMFLSDIVKYVDEIESVNVFMELDNLMDD